jgi:3-isopropylmalate/(R)-2-methylmalate dehydratase small subunit
LANKGYRLTVDLESQSITEDKGFKISFEIDPFKKRCLLEGLDDIGLTLRHEDKIRAYEERRGLIN